MRLASRHLVDTRAIAVTRACLCEGLAVPCQALCPQSVRMTADSAPPSLTFADSSDVRDYPVEALKLDLVGPGAGHDLADELLPVGGDRRSGT